MCQVIGEMKKQRGDNGNISILWLFIEQTEIVKVHWSINYQLLLKKVPEQILHQGAQASAKLKAFYQKCLVKSHRTPAWELKGNIIISILQKGKAEALEQSNAS